DVHPGGHRRVDLHVRPDPRRLHRARVGLDEPVHRQRDRDQCRAGPAARRGVLARATRDHPHLPRGRAPPRRLQRALMTLGRGTRLALRIATAVVLVFIYVPLTLVVIYAFNESGTSAWPPSGFTLDWVKAALDNTGLQQAFLTSV